MSSSSPKIAKTGAGQALFFKKKKKNMKQSVVNIKGEWVCTESKEIEFLGIEEGPQGEDVLEFNYKGETYKRTVYR